MKGSITLTPDEVRKLYNQVEKYPDSGVSIIYYSDKIEPYYENLLEDNKNNSVSLKYRKKPVIIDAIQWTGLNPTEIKDFAGDAANLEYYDAAWELGKGPVIVDITIHTLEGDMHVNKGDYIIKGIKGEFYPCKPDIFENTYEKIDE